jgi:hypothetical protein
MTETTITPSQDAIPGRFIPGVLAGLVAALAGAVIWAVITVTTEHQIGFMAIGVGFLVGYAVRTVGRGSGKEYGIAGALLALLGCVLGNLFSACGFIAQQNSLSVWAVISSLGLADMVNIIGATFEGMDLLFYAIAIYEGFKLSILRPSAQSAAQPG